VKSRISVIVCYLSSLFAENAIRPTNKVRFMNANRSPNHTPVISPVIPGIGVGPAKSASRGFEPSGKRHTSRPSAAAGRGARTLISATAERGAPKRFRPETTSMQATSSRPSETFLRTGRPAAGRRPTRVGCDECASPRDAATAVGIARSIALGKLGWLAETFRRTAVRRRAETSSSNEIFPANFHAHFLPRTSRRARCIPRHPTVISSVSPRTIGWILMSRRVSYTSKTRTMTRRPPRAVASTAVLTCPRIHTPIP